MAPETKFYTQAVLLKCREAADIIAEEVAFAVEAEAKANIVDNDQVDTGFMLNSVYAVTRSGSGYGQAQGAAKSRNPTAEMGPGVSLSGNIKAAVVVGAEYAIYQEEKKTFLFKAGESVKNQLGGIIEKVGREAITE
jgi:hypothetical protein